MTEYQIKSGNASPVEVAAVLAALETIRFATPPLHSAKDRPIAGGWNSYYRTVRVAHAPGRDAWRTTMRF